MGFATLSASSAKIGSFPRRILCPRVENFSYQKSGQQLTGEVFKARLLGFTSSNYVVTWPITMKSKRMSQSF